MDNQTRIRRARTFDAIADLYHQGRPETAPQVFDELFSRTGLDHETTRVLEIGCGAAQATLPLARRGCRLLALEMGPHLARIARQKLAAYPQATVLNTRFEDWQPDQSFDLVFSADAWHWIDPETRYPRAGAALRPSGILAIVRAHHAFPTDADPFFAQIQSTYDQLGLGSMPWPPPTPDQLPDLRAEIEASGCFSNIHVSRILHHRQFTADQYIARIRTDSDYSLLPPASRESLEAEMRRLIDARPGRRILRHTLSLLHIARKSA